MNVPHCQIFDVLKEYEHNESDSVLLSLSLLIEDNTGGSRHINKELLKDVISNVLFSKNKNGRGSRKERLSDLYILLDGAFKLKCVPKIKSDIDAEIIYFRVQSIVLKKEWELHELLHPLDDIFLSDTKCDKELLVIQAIMDSSRRDETASIIEAYMNSCKDLEPISEDFDMIKEYNIMIERSWPKTLIRLVISAWSITYRRSYFVKSKKDAVPQK